MKSLFINATVQSDRGGGGIDSKVIIAINIQFGQPNSSILQYNKLSFLSFLGARWAEDVDECLAKRSWCHGRDTRFAHLLDHN